VYGDARVYGNAQVYGDAWVYGNAQVSFGILTADIFECLQQYIACSLNVYPINGEYLLYKRVNKIKDGEWASCRDRGFIYKAGKYKYVKDFDPDKSVSCSEGIHVSTPFYWDEGDTLIAVKVKVGDIITCQEGKLRVKGATPIGEVR
ncbi:MAG: DUF5758 domain-containing protein, partial [Methanocellales archaeon]|nr:DUF5758 domain-containing protein [Methanocellales archaeon]